MEQATYTTRGEAIEREIIEVIEAGDASRDGYDIDAIADAVIGDYEDGFTIRVNEADFWGIVADNAK